MSNEIINKDELFSDRWVPYRLEVLRSPVLSFGAKVLYGEIVSYFWQDDARKAWPSQELLAQNLNRGVTTIKELVKELVTVGVIDIHRPGLGKNNEYFLLKPDPVRLCVCKDEKGAWKPVAITDSRKTDYQDSQKTDYQDSQKTDYQIAEKLAMESEVSGADSLDVTRVPSIDVGGEEQVLYNKKREEEVSATLPLISNLIIDRKETYVCALDSPDIQLETALMSTRHKAVETPNTKLSGNEKSPKESETHPDSILFSQVPPEYRIRWNTKAEPVDVNIDGIWYKIIDDRAVSQEGASPTASPVEVPSFPAEAHVETQPPVVVASVDVSLDVQSANSNEVDINLEAQLADGFLDYDGIEGECPTCGSGLYLERGCVKCLNCDWEFGYRKFKERFLSEQEGDDLISPQQVSQNRFNLNLLLADAPSKKSEGEKLFDELALSMSETRFVPPSAKLFGGNQSVECSIDASILCALCSSKHPLIEALTSPTHTTGNVEKNDKVNGNGNGGKRSKQETLRLLKAMDLSAGIEGET